LHLLLGHVPHRGLELTHLQVNVREVDAEHAVLQLAQLHRQRGVVPLRQLPGLVVHDPIGARLLLGHVHHVHLGGLHAQLLHRHVPSVARDDHVVLVHHNRLHVAVPVDARLHRLDRLRTDHTRVVLVRLDLVDLHPGRLGQLHSWVTFPSKIWSRVTLWLHSKKHDGQMNSISSSSVSGSSVTCSIGSCTSLTLMSGNSPSTDSDSEFSISSISLR